MMNTTPNRPVRSPEQKEAEAALMLGVKMGDHQAIQTLWGQYGTLVYRLSVARAQHNKQLNPDNAVAEIFVALYQAAKTYDPEIPLNVMVIKTTLYYLRKNYPAPDLDKKYLDIAQNEGQAAYKRACEAGLHHGMTAKILRLLDSLHRGRRRAGA